MTRMFRNVLTVSATVAFTTCTAQWTQLDLNTDIALLGVEYRADGNVWIGAYDTIHYSTDAGDTFGKRPVLVTEFGNNTIIGGYGELHVFDPSTAVISGLVTLGDAEIILRTTNGGLSYNVVHNEQVGLLDEVRDIDFSLAPIGLAVCTEGRILRTTDNGLTWTAVPSGTNELFSSIAHVGGTTYLAGTTFGPMLRSTDGGLNWSVVPGVTSMQHLAAQGPVCYAGTGGGTILFSDDGGLTWEQRYDFGTSIDVLQVLDNNTILVGRPEGLYRSTTGGLYWEIFDLPGFEPLNDMDFRDATNGIAVGSNGYAIRTGNGGGAALPVFELNAPSGSVCPGVELDFQATGDPMWTYNWIVDGSLSGTGPSFTTQFTATGDHEVEVQVSNGTGTVTETVSFNVPESPFVAPFAASANPDTICANGNLPIDLPASQTGVQYRMWRNGTPTGSLVTGDGGALTWTLNNVQATDVISAVGISTTACGSDTAFAPIAFTVFNGSPGTSFALAEDSLCVPGSAQLVVLNAQGPGYSYFYDCSGLPDSPEQPGNGGTLTFDTPLIPDDSPGQYSFLLRVRYTNLTCTASLPGEALLRVFDNAFTSTLADTTIVVGQTINADCTPGNHNVILWDFGAGATPPTFSGEDPPAVTFAVPGVSTVTVNAAIGSGSCSAEETASVTVVPLAATTDLPSCGSGTTDGGLFISDMYLDRFNNVYLTGQQSNNFGGSRQFFAMKLDSTGNTVWDYRHPVGGNNPSFGIGITADQEGNAYVTGQSPNVFLTVLGHPLQHSDFLLKFDRQGLPVWNIASPELRMRGLTCTADNTIWMAGHGAWNGGLLMLPDGTEYHFPAAEQETEGGEAFLVGIDPNGHILEAESFGRAFHPDSAATGFAIDFDQGTADPQVLYRTDPRVEALPDGELLLSGIYGAQRAPLTYAFGDIAVVNNAPLDSTWNRSQVYVARYAPASGFAQAIGLLGGGIATLQRLELAVDGSFYLTGLARNALVHGSTAQELALPEDGSDGPLHGFIAKASASGASIWRSAADAFDPFDLSVTEDGATFHVLASFNGNGAIPVTSGALTGLVSAGGADHMLVRYTEDGIVLSVDQRGSSTGDHGYRMRPDACGNLHLAAVSGFTGNYTVTDPMTCNGCTGNVSVEVVGTSACGGICYGGYDPASRDVALDGLRLSVVDPMLSGPRDLIIDLSGQGLVTATSIELGYRINGGAPSSFDWTGSLAYAQLVQDVAIASPDLGAVNHYTIDVWINTVNGSPDDSRWNDTLRIEQIVCAAPIVGSYTLGTVGDDFPSFNAANDVLVTCGVDGSTHIVVEDGTYYGQLSMGHIAGATANDTIVFRSASADSSAVRLHAYRRYATDFDLWSFTDGADHVTLQDLSLFGNTGVALNHRVVGIHDDHERLRFNRCLLQQRPDRFGFCMTEGSASPGTDLRLEDCIFRNGGWGFLSNNPSQSGNDEGMLIRGCFFDGQFDTGLSALYRINGLVVENNRVFTDRYHPEVLGYSGLHVGFPDCGPMVVRGNSLLRAVPQDTVNMVGAIALFEPGGAGTGRSLIANNMIVSQYTAPGLPSPGIQLSMRQANAKGDFINNSFGARVVVSIFDQMGEFVFRNNIVTSQNLVMSMFFNQDSSLFIFEDNVYWSEDPAYNATPFRINWDTLTMAQRQAGWGWDLNADQVEPVFISDTDHHLAADANTFFCTTSPLVPTDIDGDLRGQVLTRQGADEGDASVGYADKEVRNGPWLWPNPNKGTFSISDVEGTLLELRIMDPGGRMVERASPVHPGGGTFGLDLAPGAYHAQAITENGGVQVIPFIVTP